MMNPLDTLGLISPPWIFGEIADPPTYQHDDTWNPPSLFGSFLLFGDVRNDLLVEFTTWKFYSRCGSWISINLGAPKTQQLNGCLFLKGVTWNLWCSRGFNMKKKHLSSNRLKGGGGTFLGAFHKILSTLQMESVERLKKLLFGGISRVEPEMI